MTKEPQRIEIRIIATVLAIAVVAYSVLRLPTVLFSAGQMDEQWFAVPGYTVWNEGIPRIPYCPTRKRENFFENADRCLFALPPALHYVQAPFFGIFPAGYPTARIPSFLGGILGIIVLGLLTRKMLGAGFAWSMGMILFAMSRPMMFTGITARPDMLCIVCCWGAIACMWRWADRTADMPGVPWGLVAAGCCCGLGLLFHPFALVACLQCGVWGCLRSGTWRTRCLRGAALALPALAVVSLWLPLILQFPYEFQSQFTSNVLERSGPGLLQRLLWPWASLWHHAGYQWEYNQAIQFTFLALGGTLGLAVLGLRNPIAPDSPIAPDHPSTPRPPRNRGRIALLVVSSVYLTATVAGLHPTKGYWLYAIGWLYPLSVFGWTAAAIGIARRLGGRFAPAEVLASNAWVRRGWAAFLIAMMMPGTGLTTLVAYTRDGAGPRTNATRFVQQLLQEIPDDARCIVDVHFVFDVWLSGRPTRLCQPRERFWGDTYPEFDYLLIGREGSDADAPNDYRAKRLRTVGQRSTPADCYVDIYTPEGPVPDGETL